MRAGSSFTSWWKSYARSGDPMMSRVEAVPHGSNEGATPVAPMLPSLRGAVTFALALGVALPINVAFGEIELAAGVAQAIAVASVFLLLPAQFMADCVRPRGGSEMRLAVFVVVLTSIMAWAAGAIERGTSLGATLSVLNWIALGGMVVLGQALVGDLRRLEVVIRTWTAIQGCVAGGSVMYLIGRFGSQLVTSTARTPFQQAMHEILPSWPNGAGLTFAVTACMCYGQIRGGRSGIAVRLQLAVLVTGALVTFSRNAWLSTAAGVGMMMFVTRDRSRSLVPPVLFGAAVMGLVSLLPPIRYQIEASWTPGASEQLSILERLAFAAEAVRVWRDHPLVGIGFARFDEFANLARLSTGTTVAAGYVPGSVHNEYLSTLVKGGIVSAGSFFAFVLLSGRMLYRLATRAATDPRLRRLGIVGVGILTVLCVGGFGGESFRQIAISAPFWLLVGGVSMLLPWWPQPDVAGSGSSSRHRPEQAPLGN
jgi:O-antigen ligase